MNTQEFLTRFSLSPLSDQKKADSSRFKPNEHSTSAAVLVPLIEQDGELHIVFTTRAKHLRHHPGQVSFPGGKSDETDQSLIDTALRESYEEIGLLPELVTPIGWLPTHHTITNFTIYPLVGLIKKEPEFNINYDEVNDVFFAPLNHFITRQTHSTISPTFNNSHHKVHFMPYQGRMIWGATAAILDKLTLHFE